MDRAGGREEAAGVSNSQCQWEKDSGSLGGVSKIGTNNLLTRQWSALAICVDKSVLTYDRLNKYQERERVWA